MTKEDGSGGSVQPNSAMAGLQAHTDSATGFGFKLSEDTEGLQLRKRSGDI